MALSAAWNIRKIASFLQNTQYFVLIIAEFGYISGVSWRIRHEIPVLDNYRRGIRGAIRRAGLVQKISASAKKGLRRTKRKPREMETDPEEGKNRHGRAIQRHGNKENGEIVASKNPIK